jgi:hypothetical protein
MSQFGVIGLQIANNKRFDELKKCGIVDDVVDSQRWKMERPIK